MTEGYPQTANPLSELLLAHPPALLPRGQQVGKQGVDFLAQPVPAASAQLLDQPLPVRRVHQPVIKHAQGLVQPEALQRARGRARGGNAGGGRGGGGRFRIRDFWQCCGRHHHHALRAGVGWLGRADGQSLCLTKAPMQSKHLFFGCGVCTAALSRLTTCATKARPPPSSHEGEPARASKGPVVTRSPAPPAQSPGG